MQWQKEVEFSGLDTPPLVDMQVTRNVWHSLSVSRESLKKINTANEISKWIIIVKKQFNIFNIAVYCLLF